MKENSSTQGKLPPASAIERLTLRASSSGWFEYLVRVQPHHTDYSGNVWHGTYLTWMEEARVECLRSLGIDFADLVALGCDLPVVDLSVRYHRAVRMGMTVVVKARMENMSGVRLNWDYEIQSIDAAEVYLTGRVTLVPVDREKGKIMRSLPPVVKDALMRLSS